MRGIDRGRLIAACIVLAACVIPGTAAAEEAPATIRVATFNIFNRPWKRQLRFGSQRQVLAALDADLVALQEVARGIILLGDPIGILAEGLRLDARAHYWHEENLGLFRTGIALLSRHPLAETEYHEFARHQFWDAKGYMSARVQLPGGPLRVVNLHMASTDDEAIKSSEFNELELYLRRLAEREPVLVMGDFNTEKGNPLLERFMASLEAQSLWSRLPAERITSTWNDWFSGRCDEARDAAPIDHILLVPARDGSARLRFAGGEIVRARGLQPPPSDHCAVYAKIAR